MESSGASSEHQLDREERLEAPWWQVREISLRLPRLGKAFTGFRIVQISDLHYGGWMDDEYLSQAVGAVADLSPDLVAITGDFVMGYHYARRMNGKLGRLAEILKGVSGRYPTVAVWGNHDCWLDPGSLAGMLRRSGIKDLNNAVHTIARGGELLHIAGVDDVMERRARLDLVLSLLPHEGCAILLAHEPDFADVSARTGRFDLQLSGHSHGGQVVFPLFGPPVLPRMGRRYPAGLYKVREMYQYTNRGIGMTTPYLRFNCRPEITVISLATL